MGARATLLSAALVVAIAGSSSATELLKFGESEWKYFDAGKSPGEGWTKADFDDTQWKSGTAPLGYGDDDIKQTVSYGDDETSKYICTYVRKVVNFDDPSAAKKVVGKLICDDGCIIYVNGEEIHRHNVPDGNLKDDTPASYIVFDADERRKFTFVVDVDKFQAGKNVVAVRLHQRGGESTDLAIDMSLNAVTEDEAIKAAEEAQNAEKDHIKQANEQAQF